MKKMTVQFIANKIEVEVESFLDLPKYLKEEIMSLIHKETIKVFKTLLTRQN